MIKNICIVALSISLVSLAACGRPIKYAASGVPGSSSPEPHQSRQNYPSLKTAADAQAHAMVRKDYSTVANFTYSKLVELMGGREEVVSTIEEEMKQLDNKGMTIVSITVGGAIFMPTNEKGLVAQNTSVKGTEECKLDRTW